MKGGLLVSSRRDVVSLLFVTWKRGCVQCWGCAERCNRNHKNEERNKKQARSKELSKRSSCAGLPVQVGGRAWVSLFAKREKRATSPGQRTSKRKTADSPIRADCPRFNWRRVNTPDQEKGNRKFAGFAVHVVLWANEASCEPTKPPVCVYWGIKASVPRDI